MIAKSKKSKNWFLKIKGKESGPYDYKQIKEKITKGEVSSFDGVKAVNQEEWGILADHEIFLSEIKVSQKELAESDIPVEGDRRRFERKPVVADVFVKMADDLKKSKAIEIAEGGMSLTSTEDLGNEGEILSMYCSPVEESIAFNFYGKVSYKVKINDRHYRYGIRFIKLSKKGIDFIKNHKEAA